MRRQRSEQEKDLSAKMLNEALKGYLTKNFAEYMLTLSENEFTNHFHGEWCSQ
ncbi:32830_t:CDS:2, partial [Gigaspora margarita]